MISKLLKEQLRSCVTSNRLKLNDSKLATGFVYKVFVCQSG